tara:strand:- start:400 stop:558 length:159 start_codon:yes stop_codon:yes gene_type:complete
MTYYFFEAIKTNKEYDEVKKLANECAKRFSWKTQAEWFNILVQIKYVMGLEE